MLFGRFGSFGSFSCVQIWFSQTRRFAGSHVRDCITNVHPYAFWENYDCMKIYKALPFAIRDHATKEGGALMHGRLWLLKVVLTANVISIFISILINYLFFLLSRGTHFRRVMLLNLCFRKCMTCIENILRLFLYSIKLFNFRWHHRPFTFKQPWHVLTCHCIVQCMALINPLVFSLKSTKVSVMHRIVAAGHEQRYMYSIVEFPAG